MNKFNKIRLINNLHHKYQDISDHNLIFLNIFYHTVFSSMEQNMVDHICNVNISMNNHLCKYHILLNIFFYINYENILFYIQIYNHNNLIFINSYLNHHLICFIQFYGRHLYNDDHKIKFTHKFNHNVCESCKLFRKHFCIYESCKEVEYHIQQCKVRMIYLQW